MSAKLKMTKKSLSYAQWKQAIDDELSKNYGVDSDDLGDWLSIDAYSEGYTVQEGYAMCLSAQDMYQFLNEADKQLVDEL
jgi:hypothetical protein